MAEYIDREALLLRLKKVITTGDDFGLGMLMATSHAIECIEEAPAADVAEVKHGEWKWGYGVGGQYGIWCTNCGAGYVDSPNAEWIAKEHDYCGKCGAKMNGKKV